MPTQAQTAALLKLKATAATDAHVTVVKDMDPAPSAVSAMLTKGTKDALKSYLESISSPVTGAVLNDESALKGAVKNGFEKIENWASGSPFRRFKDKAVTEYFDDLFKHLSAMTLSLKIPLYLARADLFHAHIVCDASNPKEIDTLIVFHAKEYPQGVQELGAKPASALRLEPKIPAFKTSDAIYKRRNAIFSLRKNLYWVIDFGSAANPYAPLLVAGKPVVLDQGNVGPCAFDLNCFVNENVSTFLAATAE